MRVRRLWGVLAAGCLVGAVQLASADDDSGGAVMATPARALPAPALAASTGAARPTPTTTVTHPARRRPVLLHRQVIGYSRQHRPIVAYEIGDQRLPSVLVVGCIHGDETAGVAVTRWLVAHAHDLATVHLWVVPVLNPDGVVLGTRGNAAGVDLNRNFPYRWAERGGGGSTYSGPRSLSEPEAQAMVALIRSARPVYGVWFHQALAVVDDSQGPPAVEALFSRALHLPERRLTDYRGSAVGWEDQVRPRSAFVVELPPGRLPGNGVRSAALALVAADHLTGG